jgi:ubiquinone/menaquinone biosynthesis C-methylase UbiE
MNNPLRAAVQQRFEASRLLAMGGPMSGGAALEVGCGRGIGAGIILDRFGADRVDAFDLDAQMVDLARRRLAPRGDRVRLWTGDVTRIPSPDGTYSAVFDFGIIHHVPNWRDALREIHRVLEPGGRFYAEEVLAHFICHPLWSRLFKHPKEDRFDHDAFRDALVAVGFEVVATKTLLDDFAWFVADKPR